jgi:hypothetical protein
MERESKAGGTDMKNNILKNVTLDTNEKIMKDFRKLKAKRRFCQIMLTTKRLIIYSIGASLSEGRKVKRRKMSETNLHAIHQFEYYIDYSRNRIWVRLIGFLLFVGAIVGGYILLRNLWTPPVYPYSQIGNWVILGVVALIGLLLWLKIRKTLFIKIKSDLNDVTTIVLKVNKYNELTARYLASKIQPFIS